MLMTTEFVTTWLDESSRTLDHLDIRLPQPNIRIPISANCYQSPYQSPIIAFLRRLFGSSVASQAAMSAAKTKAQSIIDENAVGMSLRFCFVFMSTNVDLSLPAVFSKSYCPYCRASKTLLSELGAKFYVIEMDQVGKFGPANAVLPRFASVE